MLHVRCLFVMWVGLTWSVLSGDLLAAEPAIPRGFMQNQQRFAFELYEQLGKHSKSNFCFAPSSIQTALAMTYAGARGETAQQMAQVLHFDLPAEELHTAFNAMQKQLNLNDPATGEQVSMANRLWGQIGYSFVPAFLNLTGKQYGAELGQVDFHRQSATARDTINAWIAKETHDKIPQLLNKDSVNSRTRLVLTNALYFLGEWVHPFDERANVKAPFVGVAGDSNEIPYMTQTQRFGYANYDGVQALELPYRGDRFSFLVLLPEKADGLAALEASLNVEMLSNVTAKLRPHRVQVFLPQFKSAARFELAEVLMAMGMSMPFSPSADFSGITTSEDLFLSAVIHEAYVDVNTKGTEAAAATAIVADGGAAPPSTPVVFRAEHPFVYVIRERASGRLLFFGRMAEPKH